jgi:hypothetical protein
MEEAAVARIIGLDHVDAGQFAFQPRNRPGRMASAPP